ncbi:hypothetical protein C2G38_2027364 [Gigaspora rosea]|uniref:BACK domain-containing protein n=1 Tax=Gigaspora rosea TaxID=44941 RepID=A0A397W517_9GLOM|nr:hypothetical protein C2G38_2027364 [Gigaspora rosea]
MSKTSKKHYEEILIRDFIKFFEDRIVQFENSRAELLFELIAFDELNFDYLVNDLQKHLFKKDDIIKNDPKILLKSQDFTELEEFELLPILKRDDFSVKGETKVWDRIIQWGCAQQNPTLSTDPSKWPKENIGSMRSH